ncbi:hypothetical protein HYT26_02175 [Candidatus Pacearchaeota archaeon]|nr:hypothetical protein [Candidatus Pacearchaeota archaeon]
MGKRVLIRKMVRMLRQTIVPARKGSVLVSTVSGVSVGRDFETMVFPADSSGRPDTTKALYEDHAITPKCAKRNHRTACERFDRQNRLYKFLDGEYRPIGIGLEYLSWLLSYKNSSFAG